MSYDTKIEVQANSGSRNKLYCRLEIQHQFNGRLDTDKTTLMQYKAESKPFQPGSRNQNNAMSVNSPEEIQFADGSTLPHVSLSKM